MTQQQLLSILISLCDETNTPFALKVKKLAQEQKVEEIVALKIDPRNYDSAADFYADNTVSELLRKLEDFDLGRDLKAEAVVLFHENEQRNAVFNRYFQRLRCQNDINIVDSRMLDFLQHVKSTVGSLLGPLPERLDGRFGKGSTFGDIGKYITVPDKMSSRPTITSKARCLLPLWHDTAWSRSLVTSSRHSDPLVVPGNRFTSVPKTATSERGICIEPSINVYFQLAVGTHIKERLKRVFGYDLYTAQDRHRSMAREASVSQRWATIDLKNASDLFSYQLVRMVTPDCWFDVLDTLRATHTEVGKETFELEKFSSMGNGFTFELMTVILTAICLVLSDGKYQMRSVSSFVPRGVSLSDPNGDISVFGDDIILPSDIAPLLIKCLPAIGLMVNEKKSFLSGRFRESCGGDFFDGLDVRSFNLKKEPTNASQLIGLANAIRRLGRQHRQGLAGFNAYRRTWFRVLDTIPSRVRRLRGPEFLGDLVIHDSEDRWLERSHERLNYRSTPDGRKFVRGWVPITKKLRLSLWAPETQLAAALYGVPSSGPTPRKSGGDEIVGYRLRWLALGL